MNTPIIIGNWKMNFTATEIRSFFRVFSEIRPAAFTDSPSIGFAVPAPYIGLASSIVAETSNLNGLHIGSQNVHWEKVGAHTGEISTEMLTDQGGAFSLLGHSERRSLYGETSENVARRAIACLNAGITPVVCIGETRSQFESGETRSVLETQLKFSLAGIRPEQIGEIVIAYEPVWAIGTGLSASPKEAEAAHNIVKNFLRNAYSQDKTLEAVPILYGGSVTDENAAELLQVVEISGFLVGGASLKPDKFLKICKS